MPKFFVEENFIFGGGIRRAGAILIVSREDVEAEIAKGKKKIKKNEEIVEGKWISGLLNHCSPEDDATAELVSGEFKPHESQDDDRDEREERIKEIHQFMDENGIAYDPRWRLPRLENELVKAKKNRGL